uniref:Uncharacterized protein n=1 Tax=Vespula pensylvanica TaxID=30213 RepID=A0A834K6P4_VESPE|nr:hypothetical protein H0235_015873 [Vespula pensylvanica]
MTEIVESMARFIGSTSIEKMVGGDGGGSGGGGGGGSGGSSGGSGSGDGGGGGGTCLVRSKATNKDSPRLGEG